MKSRRLNISDVEKMALAVLNNIMKMKQQGIEPEEKTIRRMTRTAGQLLDSTDTVLLNPGGSYSTEPIGAKSKGRRFEKQNR